MSRRFSVGNLQGAERTSVIQEVQKHAKAAALAAIKPIVKAFLEAELSAKLGREKGEARQVSGQPREIDWQCGQGGCRDATQFTRDGHYRRGEDDRLGSRRGAPGANGRMPEVWA